MRCQFSLKSEVSERLQSCSNRSGVAAGAIFMAHADGGSRTALLHTREP